MPPKKHIIIIGVLCVIALGLGYVYGKWRQGSGQENAGNVEAKEETVTKDSGSGGGKSGGDNTPDSLKQGLVAYYPFNGNAKDESGNGNDGKVISATLAEDRNGENARAYSFDGENDLIEIPPSRSINAMRSLSITFWMKANKVQTPGRNGYTGLVTRWSYENLTSAFGIVIIKGKIAVSVWPSRNVNQFMPFEKEVWQHIVYTHDVSDATFYVDGKLESQRQLPINLRESNIPLIVGADNYKMILKHRFFSGQIDNVRIYNRALSEAQVKALYEFEKAN